MTYTEAVEKWRDSQQVTPTQAINKLVNETELTLKEAKKLVYKVWER